MSFATIADACCSNCPCKNGEHPDKFSVTFAGITNDAMCVDVPPPDCTNLNGTWELKYDGSIEDCCRWKLFNEGAPLGCCYDEIYLLICPIEGGYRVTVVIDSSFDPMLEFWKDYAEKPDCMSFNNEDIPTQGEIPDWNMCDSENTTCKVTAVLS